MPKIKEERQEKKEAFINLAFKDKIKAANILRAKANGLENCKTKEDIAFALSDIIYLSRSRIWEIKSI